MSRTARGQRVVWLDGVRGAAALFVVLHHIWLTAWPAFPSNAGPWWLGWLLYGHMAVAVFIVVSGFSLALAPMDNGAKLSGGVRRFVRRRAWRILPPYWAALVLSVVVTGIFVQPDVGTGALGKSFAVHGLLVQDVVGSATPNGAFWSIAVEWQIYFVFPLLLLVGRRVGLPVAVLLTAAVVLLAHTIAALGPPLDKINHLTPQFLVLFALGVLAVRLGHGDRAPALRRPMAAVAIAVLLAFVVLAVTQGSVWMVGHFFWIDCLFGIGVAALLIVMYAGGGAALRRLFASRAALWLGLFSYSIYLVHDPLVSMLNMYVFAPMGFSALGTFALFLLFGVPVILAVCYGFHQLFEAPFLHNRGVTALRAMPIVRVLRRRPVGEPHTASFAPSVPAAAERSPG
jgi:peptidoglycan/LPS O-acetylase OafA/YrhL